MKKLLFILSIFAIVLSCSSDETSTPVTPPPAPIVKYTITLSAGEGGTVSTTGGEYEAGQTVSVTATPQGEYLFKDWSDGNTNATRTITVNSNTTLTANFEKKKYPLTVNIEGEGEVLEEIVNTGRTTDYDSGTTVKLTAEPAEGWEFVGWTGDVESTSLVIEIDVTEAKTVEAKFMRYFDYNKPSYFLQHSSDNIWINYNQTLENNGVNLVELSYSCAEVYADFDGDGYEDWMTAPSYWQQERGSYPLVFYKNQGDNSTFLVENLSIENNIGTWNARKAILGDFNGDGKPDIVYPEQGEDTWPTEATRPTILMSTSNGYRMDYLSDYNMFLHTGASGDIDNDGDLDIVLSSSHVLVVYINNGNGTFVEKIQSTGGAFVDGLANNDIIILPPGVGESGFTTLEIIDINKDGYLDLVGGGQEDSMNSRIYFGNGETFTYENSKVLPYKSPWLGVIDFDFEDLDGDGDYEIISGRFKHVYEGYFVGVANLTDDGEYEDISEIVDNSDSENTRWITWLRVKDIDDNGQLDIFSNDKSHFGYGTYRWEWSGNIFEKKFCLQGECDYNNN